MDTLPRPSFLNRSGLLAACLAVCAAAAACGSSSTTITSPGSVSKCAVTLGAPDAILPATGGTGTITVRTEREFAAKLKVFKDLGFDYVQFHDDDAVPDDFSAADREKKAKRRYRLESS